MTERIHARLCAAILDLVGPARLSAARVRPWASITFSGARHWLCLHVPPDRVVQVSHALIESELVLAGHFVADLAITQRVDGPKDCALSIEILTVADG